METTYQPLLGLYFSTAIIIASSFLLTLSPRTTRLQYRGFLVTILASGLAIVLEREYGFFQASSQLYFVAYVAIVLTLQFRLVIDSELIYDPYEEDEVRK